MTDVSTLDPADIVSAKAARPAHVRDALVYEFDMYQDPALRADAHARVLDLARNAPPIFWTPHNGGHWVLLSHAANFSASRDYAAFSSEIVPRAQVEAMRAGMPAGAPHIPTPVPIGFDPPEHTKFRVPLQAAFSPKAMTALRDGIRELAGELVDAIRPRGRSEFMAEVAEPLPVQVFLKMFGLPLDRQAQYRALVKEHLSAPHGSQQEMARRLIGVAATMPDTALERKETPQSDIISLLWQARIDGRKTTLEDMQNYGVVLFLAGLDTVMNGIGLAVRNLALKPELQRLLREQPELVPAAVEEALRRFTFTVPPRRVAQDQVFQGVEMKEGDRVMLFLPAADLDAAEFPEPERYDLDRENNVHIAFGTGPHRCLGSHLARIELQIVYEELLARLPEFRLDPDNPATFHGGHVIGPETLHIVWDA